MLGIWKQVECQSGKFVGHSRREAFSKIHVTCVVIMKKVVLYLAGIFWGGK